ncbi:carbonic anhydrase [Spirillospora sp. CA-294931]|uniref:carbonic anhydrase n=1 Tax=Spirillospora sp. CA-294931 TaxID=3240042 RepID=UPI003D93EBDA
MQSFVDHARAFPRLAAERGEELDRLAAGQSPQALFISCSDSRVVPSLFTGARPGELFELRTAGNIIPPHRPDHPFAEAATIEYAVEVLEVADIVVCGHSHCGAVGAMVRGDDLSAVPSVRGWLERSVDPGPLRPHAGTDLTEAVQAHVLVQLERLRAYPAIARRTAEGRLGVHGWFYEVHTGTVFAHRPFDDRFQPL